MDDLTKNILEFINNLEPQVAYQAQLDSAIGEENYERAEAIKKNMDAECR